MDAPMHVYKPLGLPCTHLPTKTLKNEPTMMMMMIVKDWFLRKNRLSSVVERRLLTLGHGNTLVLPGAKWLYTSLMAGFPRILETDPARYIPANTECCCLVRCFEWFAHDLIPEETPPTTGLEQTGLGKTGPSARSCSQLWA